MATKIPLRATFDNSNNPTGIAEFQTNEYVPVSHGGTGLGSYSSNQILVGNSSNSLVPKTLTAGSGITITDGGTTLELSAAAPIPTATSTIIGGITVQTSTSSGLTLGVGEVDTITTGLNGSGYHDNDRLKINSGGKNAILQPATIGGGLIFTANILQAGTGYSQGTSVGTLTAGSVSGAAVQSGGTGYSNESNVTTTGTYGTGLTLDITTTGGEITGVTVNTGGSGYFAGDVISISGGDSNANATISSVAGGIFVSGTMQSAGTGYNSTQTNATTSGGNGTGLTVNTTIDGSGGVSGIVVNYGGSGYQINDVITVVGGNSDATFKITNIKGSGSGYTVDVSVIKTGDLVHAKKTNSSIQVGPGSGNNTVISYLNVDKYGHIQGTIETKEITIDASAEAVAMAIALG